MIIAIIHNQMRNMQSVLQKFKIAVPIFHAFGHTSSCQVRVYSWLCLVLMQIEITTVQLQYSPRFQEGFGLTDGEVLERLWSYLRRFSKMTKEMTPSHRIDVLSDALLHYAETSALSLGIFTYCRGISCYSTHTIFR